MNQFINDCILAVETKDITSFNNLTAMGITRYGEDKVQECLNEKLPLYLGNTDMKTLLRFMVDQKEDIYIELVTTLLTEIIKVLQKTGYEFGKDFSYKQVNKLPSLCIKNIYADKVIPLYTEAAWRQCSPFIIFMEEK